MIGVVLLPRIKNLCWGSGSEAFEGVSFSLPLGTLELRITPEAYL